VAQAAVVLLALVVAFAPRPASVVERFYAARLYPAIQSAVTTASNAVPIAVFDVVLVVAILGLLWVWSRALRAARRVRGLQPLASAAGVTATAVAVGYLWFVAVWGLNYARPPLDVRLSLPEAPASAEEVRALLTRAVDEVNGLYRSAHADRFVPDDAERDIARALRAVEARHGRPRATVPGRPKPTLLAPYFRMAGVDGLTAPAALETLLNPDLTDAERPFVLAHEWAHLAGYAGEADANFVAWLATMEERTEPETRYSGWLFLVMETAAQVPREARRASLEQLGEGPRRDLDAIAARARQRVDVVQRVGWRVYDQYLRSQGVRDGVVSYSRVVDLIARASRDRGGGRGPSAPVPQ
jgi:hypothetical protein